MSSRPSVYDAYDDINVHATWLKRVPRTIIRWSDEPDGLPFTTLGNQRLFKREWTLEWLEKRRVKRNPRRGRRAA